LKKPIERRITAVVIATGVSSVVTQLLVIREFLSQFHGNEFVIALILFNWLLLGGMGTLFASAAGKKAGPVRLAWISLALVGLSPLELLGIRIFRDICFIHGSAVGFYATLAFSFLAIAPYGLLLGFALPYSLIAARNNLPGYSGTRIYITDNIGDVLGGVLFSFALVVLVSPLKAVLIANLPLLAAACWIHPYALKLRSPVSAAALAALILLVAGAAVETSTLVQAGKTLAYYHESRYGRIEIFKDQDQYTLVLDGNPMYSSENTNIAEETVHYPLAQLHQVNNLLMISAEGGVMAEAEKYGPETVDYLEIDATLTDAVFKFGLVKKIPGLRVIHQDGRAYLKETKKKYDAILLNLPEPDTFQLNRFFTDRFFMLAKTRLAPKGILSFSVEGYANYINDAQIEKISSLYQTARLSFSHVLMLPGQKVFFLCADFPLDTDIPKRLEEKKIQTDYIAGFYYGNLTDERITELHRRIKPDAPLNLDDSPRLIRLMFFNWFTKFATSPGWFIAAVTLLLGIYLCFITREGFVLFSTGFMAMGSEILVIFAFQIFLGYIYVQIGLIVTVFLAGLLPGAVFGEALRRHSRGVLLFGDGALIGLLGMFIAAVLLMGDRLPMTAFLLFGFAVSVACGCQFPAALHLQGSGKPAAIHAFSADLIGAAFGTLITSVILIPYAGIVWTAAALIVLKTISFMVTKAGHEKTIQKTICCI